MSENWDQQTDQSDNAESAVSGSRHTVHEVCRITGIEPARIRFIENEFEEQLGGCQSGTQGLCYDGHGIELIRTIHQRIFVEGHSVFTVRQMLALSGSRLKIIAVTSGKGGVGKTTMCLNLAIAMGRRGLRTLLLDADMGLGNVHVFGGIAPRGSMLDLIDGSSNPRELLSPGPAGIQVLCNGSGSARLADLPLHLLERLGSQLLSVGRGFDVMLIDTGAGISAQVTTFLAMADEIVVVTTPNIAATLDAYGVIKVVRENPMRGRIHLLVNQADEEEQARAVYDKIRLCAERFLGYSPSGLGGILRDMAMEESNQNRQPLVLSQPDHWNSRMIAKMADTLFGGNKADVLEEACEPELINFMQ